MTLAQIKCTVLVIYSDYHTVGYYHTVGFGLHNNDLPCLTQYVFTFCFQSTGLRLSKDVEKPTMEEAKAAHLPRR